VAAVATLETLVIALRIPRPLAQRLVSALRDKVICVLWYTWILELTSSPP